MDMFTDQKKILKNYIKSKLKGNQPGDDFGYTITTPPTNPYDYEAIYKRFKKLMSHYDLKSMKKLVGNDFGINPLDLFMLKSFIEQNKIKNVLELGAGTSSSMLDNMSVARTSYALESIFYEHVHFEKIDIFKYYPIVEDFIKNNPIDMLVIDCEHSFRMARLIDTKLLPLLNYTVPLFLHDWYDYDKQTYAEQVYYVTHLLDKYDVTYMTDLPPEILDKLKKANDQIDNEAMYKKLGLRRGHLPIRRCSAILTPKKIPTS